jgi:hypothetical protein
MFHVVYSRDYWDTEDQGTFANTWTLYRNVSYFKLREMQKSIPSLLKNADKTYAEYESKQEHKSDPTQFHKSEVYVVDNSDYFKTYKDMYPDSYMGPSGLIPEKEDYFHSYGQKCQFMLLKDFDESYTWFGKDFTQEQIDQAYEDRDNKYIKEIVDSHTA